MIQYTQVKSLGSKVNSEVKSLVWLLAKEATLTQDNVMKRAITLCSSISWTMPGKVSEALKSWEETGVLAKDRGRWRLIPASIWWAIWKERNSRDWMHLEELSLARKQRQEKDPSGEMEHSCKVTASKKERGLYDRGLESPGSKPDDEMVMRAYGNPSEAYGQTHKQIQLQSRKGMKTSFRKDNSLGQKSLKQLFPDIYLELAAGSNCGWGLGDWHANNVYYTQEQFKEISTTEEGNLGLGIDKVNFLLSQLYKELDLPINQIGRWPWKLIGKVKIPYKLLINYGRVRWVMPRRIHENLACWNRDGSLSS
ncbi:hypothetical protein H5410_051523 [Solanum commersonii]|uniref:Uncharacterized protein n=1 Tax=Solanum commersonii TaxID=4109 RepID=A0A9J5X185_SOLCO|nr:hypothetical protein H5410_051523 [Solanum commersonii]